MLIKMKKYLYLVFFTLVFASCVPSKDLIYLQGNPIEKKEIKRINNVPYKLQVDDIINIDIKSSNEELVSVFNKQSIGGSNSSGIQANVDQGGGYFTDYSVDNYGNVRLPTLGEINVLGYTTLEVRKKIEKKLREYIKPGEALFVSVKLSGIRYTIIGEINNPGPNIIFQNRVSIIDAIANSGDIPIVGNRKKVEVIRKTITGVEKYTIDLTNIEAFNSDVFYIKPNDIINVIPLKQKAWGTGTTGLQTVTTVVSIFTLITSTFILARNL